MIAVEIPAALADRPEVVPVDMWRDPNVRPPVNWLVGQRVALAWRETCPLCEGRKRRAEPSQSFERQGLAIVGCSGCFGAGFRMVVGWTAEVEAVVPIVDRGRNGAHVVVVNGAVAYYVDAIGRVRVLPAAYWSPGRYAVVLRDVFAFAGAPWCEPVPCRPFEGFTELSEVLG